jgi:hypothetical protein
MFRKFPDKRYNRQNFILLHETIPLHVLNYAQVRDHFTVYADLIYYVPY